MPRWFPRKRLSAWRPRQMVRLAGLACLGLLVVLVILLAVPILLTLFGYRSYVVYGGSMGSSLPIGSIGVTKTVDSQSLKDGDIIAIKRVGAGPLVLHRIVETRPGDAGITYVTQGDTNPSPDPEPVTIQGQGDKVVLTIPYLGYLVHFARGTIGRLLLLLLPSLLLLGMVLWQQRQSAAEQVHVGEDPGC